MFKKCNNNSIVQENGNRFFMITNENDFKEIGLSAKAAGLLMNANKHKPDEKFDCNFLKGLLIGFCSIPKIKANEVIEDAVLVLMKELFEWRVGPNKHRINRFDSLLTNAIKGIKKNDFKP